MGNVGWSLQLWSMVSGGGYVSGSLLVQAVTSFRTNIITSFHKFFKIWSQQTSLGQVTYISAQVMSSLPNLKFEPPMYILNFEIYIMCLVIHSFVLRNKATLHASFRIIFC